jgi:hypothetical protein
VRGCPQHAFQLFVRTSGLVRHRPDLWRSRRYRCAWTPANGVECNPNCNPPTGQSAGFHRLITTGGSESGPELKVPVAVLRSGVAGLQVFNLHVRLRARAIEAALWAGSAAAVAYWSPSVAGVRVRRVTRGRAPPGFVRRPLLRNGLVVLGGAEDLPERDGHVEVPIPCECDEVVELRLRAEQI